MGDLGKRKNMNILQIQSVEKLDCAVYAYAALNHLYQRFPRGKIYEIFTNRLLKSVNSNKNNLKDAKVNTSAKRNYVNSW